MRNEIQFLVIILFLIPNVSFSQTKYEKEYRLSSKDVPPPAIEFVKRLKFTKKIKWYQEEGIGKTSIEAKTKHRSQRYSVEFNTKGEIEDIEVKIKMKAVPDKVRQEILNYLNASHKKVKICKIQIQFSGDPEELINTIALQNLFDAPNVTTNYELVVKAKTGKKYQKLEYLFNHKGEMLTKAVILLKNTDNLEY